MFLFVHRFLELPKTAPKFVPVIRVFAGLICLLGLLALVLPWRVVNAIGRLVAGILHEINSPLGAL